MLLLDLVLNKLSTDESALIYLMEVDVIPKAKRCPSKKCRREMVMNISRKNFRCPSKLCRKEISIFKKTFFSHSKLELHKIILLCYLYLHQMPVESILISIGIYSEAASAWTSYIRQACGDMIDYEHVKVGGEGIIVEVDETKLGKRKYHRGHRVEGVWVLVGVERTVDKKIFCIELPDRTAKTLKRIMNLFIMPGSIIYTDGWAAYNSVCMDLGFEHHVVNHSQFFKDPIYGTHTNTVEGCNNALKICIKPQHRIIKNINEHLFYFLWRRQNKNNIWEAFMLVLKELLYD